jgi:hypothetical protein
VPPLAVASLGWVCIVLGPRPTGTTLDIAFDIGGWLLVALAWWRMVRAAARFALAARVALTAACVAALRLLPASDAVTTVTVAASAILVMAGLALSAWALLDAAKHGESPIVAAQASFLRGSALGLLIVQVGAALGYLITPDMAELFVVAAALGIVLGLWFAVLLLVSAGFGWARPRRMWPSSGPR